MDGRRSQLLIPIACRFGACAMILPLVRSPLIPSSIVASDQWLTTQFDATLKISEVKQYILTKVYNSDGMTSDYLSSRDRPVSPITFASVLPSPDSFDDSTEDSHEDERVADPEIHIFLEPTRQPRGRQAPKPRLASPTTTEEPPEPEPRAAMLPPHRYQMLAFSTGQLLEDDYSLSWYRLRPHELLELHPPDTMVRLPREVMLEYIQPYLELDVRALRVVVNAKDAHSTSYLQDVSSNKIKKARDPSGESRGPSGGVGGPAAPPSIRKRRKMKLEWRDRYLVIRQGMLSLFKSRSVSRGCRCGSFYIDQGVCLGSHAGAHVPTFVAHDLAWARRDHTRCCDRFFKSAHRLRQVSRRGLHLQRSRFTTLVFADSRTMERPLVRRYNSARK